MHGTRPRILVTTDTGEVTRRGVPSPVIQLKSAYVAAVERAKGTPILAAPTSDLGVRRDLLEIMDALVITGGSFDIDPSLYGRAQSSVRLDPTKPMRTDFEVFMLRAALEREVPILGVCGGMQLLNVIRGGTLFQDLATQLPEALEHEQPTEITRPHHPVHIEAHSPLAKLLDTTEIQVNSTHHQAIDALGEGIEVAGRAPDGVIEAIVLGSDVHVVGVEWHPEQLDDEASRRLYANLVERAARRTAP